MAKQPENRARLRSLLRNEDGITAVIFAVLLPVFVVIAALAVDMGYAFQKRNMLQVDASAACLAITRRAQDGPNNNPLPLFLAAAVGLSEVDINTAAIATVGAETPIGFNGCLMALNPDEDATFYANGGRYRLSAEEFLNWEQLIAAHGLRGLRVTRTQEYRQSERNGDRREEREV